MNKEEAKKKDSKAAANLTSAPKVMKGKKKIPEEEKKIDAVEEEKKECDEGETVKTPSNKDKSIHEDE